ncbi:Uma2 family endonuclease [Nonomuraea sp. NPDC002799]
MTPEAVSPHIGTPSLPDWAPPPQGFAAEDLDTVPDLPAHTELLDGSLVFASPRASGHAHIVDLLLAALRQAAPEDLRVRREMSVILGASQRPEPDLIVIKAAAARNLAETSYQAAEVILVAEVVSPESKIRDRHRKPELYAKAGIPHFWRIENDADKPVVYVYALDPATRTYALTGIHYQALKLDVPFDVAVDLSAIDEL